MSRTSSAEAVYVERGGVDLTGGIGIALDGVRTRRTADAH